MVKLDLVPILVLVLVLRPDGYDATRPGDDGGLVVLLLRHVHLHVPGHGEELRGGQLLPGGQPGGFYKHPQEEQKGAWSTQVEEESLAVSFEWVVEGVLLPAVCLTGVIGHKQHPANLNPCICI